MEEVARRVGLGGVPVGVLVTGVVVLVLATALAVWRFWPGAVAPERGAGVEVSKAASPVEAPEAGASTRENASSSTTATAVWVHVVGAVRRPGVYELPVGSRVGQAIERAGGVLGNGAAEGVNMARPVVDGEQIAVPTRGE
ncbi:MAG: SLBB domain-containing protein, partial [Coriobacteriales bacterium]|nr:SLBB domain-containing protein [Coriobacteriales bacterium]